MKAFVWQIAADKYTTHTYLLPLHVLLSFYLTFKYNIPKFCQHPPTLWCYNNNYLCPKMIVWIHIQLIYFNLMILSNYHALRNIYHFRQKRFAPHGNRTQNLTSRSSAHWANINTLIELLLKKHDWIADVIRQLHSYPLN